MKESQSKIKASEKYPVGVHHCSPYNSTPFTDCCNVACIDEANCPSCGLFVYGHHLYYSHRRNARFNYAFQKSKDEGVSMGRSIDLCVEHNMASGHCSQCQKMSDEMKEVIEPSSELGDVEKVVTSNSIDWEASYARCFKENSAVWKSYYDQKDQISTLTKQLDEVTKVKERYKIALEFYADRNSWKLYSYKNDCKDTIEFSDLGCKSFSDKADFACSSGGRRAREALNGSG